MKKKDFLQYVDRLDPFFNSLGIKVAFEVVLGEEDLKASTIIDKVTEGLSTTEEMIKHLTSLVEEGSKIGMMCSGIFIQVYEQIKKEEAERMERKMAMVMKLNSLES